MSLQGARSTKRKQRSTCCIVSSGVGAGVDEAGPDVAHAASAGLGAGDDDFVARQLRVGVEDGARMAVEERDDAPHRERRGGGSGCRAGVRTSWSKA